MLISKSDLSKIFILKFLNVLLLVVVWPVITNASPLPHGNSLLGIVMDKDKEPLEGAVVEIPDLKTGAVTDSNGHYRIDNVPKGSYLVKVTLISYATATHPVNISGETKQNFVLSESAIESHEVVITGLSKATEIRRDPVSITTVNHTYLEQNTFTNAIDALSKVPGVTSLSTGPNISKPIIRGLGYNRVLTLYDGMRLEGQQWGDEHGIEVDEYNIDHVEIIKGPASIVYGSDAIAGVVNIIPTQPAPEGKIMGNVTTEYQTNNNMIGASGMISGNSKGFYWLGRVSHKMAQDYQDPVDGRVYATNFNETDVNGSLGVNKSWGFSHLNLSLFDDLQAIPDGSRDSATRQFTKQITETDTYRPIVSYNDLHTYSLPVLHQHVQLYRAMLANSFNVGGGQLGVNLGFERSIRQEFSHPEYGSIPGLDLQLNTYTYDVKYYAKEIDGWSLTAGINGMYQTNSVTQGTEFVIPSYNQFDAGPFALIKRTFGRLDFLGGVRYDSRTFHNDALYTKPDPVTGFDTYYAGSDTTGTSNPFSTYSHTYSGFTYSAGATYVFSSQLSAKVNIARGFRAPNIAEISSNGAHPGTNIYQIGNDNFKPEFSLQEDAGLDFDSRHVSASISVFNNDITNYIYNQKLENANGGDSIIQKGYQTFKFQQGHAQLYGGEISIDIHPHPLDWLHFENSASVVYALNKDSHTDSTMYLPFTPPFHGISELRGNLKSAGKWLKNGFAKVQLEYYAAQNRVFSAYGTETPTPGYTLFNAGMGTDIANRKGRSIMNISVFGNNLFDVAYQDHLSRLKYFEFYPNDPRGHYGIYNMGRNIVIKLTVPFDAR